MKLMTHNFPQNLLRDTIAETMKAHSFQENGVHKDRLLAFL